MATIVQYSRRMDDPPSSQESVVVGGGGGGGARLHVWGSCGCRSSERLMRLSVRLPQYCPSLSAAFQIDERAGHAGQRSSSIHLHRHDEFMTAPDCMQRSQDAGMNRRPFK